jgi:hypothetical protein
MWCLGCAAGCVFIGVLFWMHEGGVELHLLGWCLVCSADVAEQENLQNRSGTRQADPVPLICAKPNTTLLCCCARAETALHQPCAPFCYRTMLCCWLGLIMFALLAAAAAVAAAAASLAAGHPGALWACLVLILAGTHHVVSSGCLCCYFLLQVTLEPYERDHAMVVGVYRPPAKK